jgi:hypothetical protein
MDIVKMQILGDVNGHKMADCASMPLELRLGYAKFGDPINGVAKSLIFNHLGHLVEGVLYRHPSATIVHWPKSAITNRSFH